MVLVQGDQMGLYLTRPGALFFFPFNILASLKLEQYPGSADFE